jgi:SAM-dependent methyltransferase
LREEHLTNRASWDELARVHGQDSYYDSHALVRGVSSLIEEEERALQAALGGEVDGTRVLHVQCHIGFDAITLARRGAVVTGVDFSSVALEKARGLARRCGVDIEWVCADICNLPSMLDGRFDLAWATIGIVCWIADLDGWMRSIARALAPGGQLVLIDGHPLSKMMQSTQPVQLWAPYGGGCQLSIDTGQDYATATTTGAQVQFAYGLGEIVTAALNAGLRIVELTEHTEISSNLCLGGGALDTNGRFCLRVDGQLLPVLFTLRGAKDASCA